MPDYYQNDRITTLQDLRTASLSRLEVELDDFCRQSPASLCIPALATDFFSPAMEGIIEQLKAVSFIDQLIIPLDGCDRNSFGKAKKIVSELPQDAKLIPADSEQLQAVYDHILELGLYSGQRGKGRAVWIAACYAIASGKSRYLFFHDADIITYSKDLLSRLCWPLMSPELDFKFVKGYYARTSKSLHGRATRLFVYPLIQSLIEIIGPHPLLKFLAEFRYPLAGEFGFELATAKDIHFSHNWSLEISLLIELFRNKLQGQICQIELTDNYDHKHQTQAALVKMVGEISHSILLNIDQVSIPELSTLFSKKAKHLILKFKTLAKLNGLEFDQFTEAEAAQAFADQLASTNVEYQPDEGSYISSWNEIIAKWPTFGDDLIKIIDHENM